MAQDKDETLSRIAFEAQNYQQQGQFMQQQLGSIQVNMNEIGAALGTMRNLEKAKDNEVLLPIGAGAHARAKLTDTENVLINIGSEVIAEKPLPEAIVILEERLKRLEDTRDKLQQAVLEISKRLEQLDTEAKQILEKKGAKQ
jgi:prefoldin alpha subunit